MFERLKNRIKRKKSGASEPKAGELKIPRHIAVIMDGNGRWAQKRHLSRSVGHRYGGEALRKAAYAASELGVKYFTVYAFSTENWKRPQAEVEAIMELFFDFFERYSEELRKMDCKIRFMGSRERLPEKVAATIRRAEKDSEKRQGLQLIVAFNYGGRQEILDAVRACGRDIEEGKLRPEELDEETFQNYLYLPDVPDPDLLIRTSGEKRLSNFLLWEAAYSEFWISDVLWPDFTKEHLISAVADYNNRNRRYGGL